MAERFLAYFDGRYFEEKKKHRGILNSEGHVVQVCSEEYLVTLGLEILRAKAFPLVKLVRPLDVDEQIRRLKFSSKEVLRLLRAPDLFPSPASRARFAAILALDANLQFVQAVKELLVRDIARDVNSFYLVCARPMYQHGSKGWENFLLNMAPGTPIGLKRAETIPKSSYQVIPLGGLRIIGDAHREEEALAKWIDETPVLLNTAPAATTKLLDFDNPDEQEPNPSLRLSQQSYSMAHRPNPYKEDSTLRYDLSSHGPERLEDYVSTIGDLEANVMVAFPPAPQNAPNIFPMISIRMAVDETGSKTNEATQHQSTGKICVSEFLGQERMYFPSRVRHGNQGTMSVILPTGHGEVERDYAIKMSAFKHLTEADMFGRDTNSIYSDGPWVRQTWSSLASEDFMNSLVDWDGIRADAKLVHDSINPAAEEPETLHFDSTAEQAKFQQELDRILWMLE
ncbi:hypothetical protein AYO20_10953 [Fonsecaea nubica]|uniref:Uncharacterized protein n=1 Tax=Fonsecaea nubica TaxID=856822 RepID=A0A178C433_9EURO|nr:hypothetical protein AYO20_10953 [Fonsecaea nubica]OAL23703.1 hypothetical protein AYO20_10953 [Fonsecaea nubica]